MAAIVAGIGDQELTDSLVVLEKKSSLSVVSGDVVSGARDDDEHHSPAEVKKKRKKVGDVGSSKRPKKTRYIHQEFKKEAPRTLGIVPDDWFVRGDDRHLFVPSGLADLAKSIVVLQQKPLWV